MKVPIDSINSAGIRNEMSRDSYTTADFIGTYSHPKHPDSNDWTIRIYYAADALVADTNGDPVWDGSEGFESLLAEYGIERSSLTAE